MPATVNGHDKHGSLSLAITSTIGTSITSLTPSQPSQPQSAPPAPSSSTANKFILSKQNSLSSAKNDSPIKLGSDQNISSHLNGSTNGNTNTIQQSQQNNEPHHHNNNNNKSHEGTNCKLNETSNSITNDNHHINMNELNLTSLNNSEPFLYQPPLSGDPNSKESYKNRRKNYKKEKKKVCEELLSTQNDPTVVILADWLKVRTTLKNWTKLWCELKPGLLLLYKSNKTYKSGQWVGTIWLSDIKLRERPSKKIGFCFTIWNPMEHSIWAPKGPHGESFVHSIMLPLPESYVIFRAPSDAAGRSWMDGVVKSMELSFRSTSILMRNLAKDDNPMTATPSADDSILEPSLEQQNDSNLLSDSLLNDSEIEKRFKDDFDDDVHTDQYSQERSDSDSDDHRGNLNGSSDNTSEASQIQETPYVPDETVEEFGIAGDAGQTEEFEKDNKNLIWTILKQVRPGMDLSKVVLPTFILEPRSFLDKLSDYYYHSDIISSAVLQDDPLIRMKMIVKWYLAGFYKKPKGLKKPYNPILGERFRCFWSHPETNSRTFYIAEQVSHHPPISAFYVTNRQDGFCISGSILAKSKFYGNSISAILDGTATLSLLTRGEDYLITMPYAHCKGIIMGPLGFELGGKVEIKCEKTGYHTEMEFRLKPFLSTQRCNLVVGKIKLGKETLANLEGHWDSEIFITDKNNDGIKQLFWSPTPDIRAKRLKRFRVPIDQQERFESEKLWERVSKAILDCDQVAATEEKTKLEEEQRKGAKERLMKNENWLPKSFVLDVLNDDWVYKYADKRPWDPRTDVIQYEHEFFVETKTKHKPPTIILSTNSLIEAKAEELLRRVGSIDNQSNHKHNHFQRKTSCASEESSSVIDSTENELKIKGKKKNETKLMKQQHFDSILKVQEETLSSINNLKQSLDLMNERQEQMQRYLSNQNSRLQRNSSENSFNHQLNRFNDISLIIFIVIIQVVLSFFIKMWQ